MKFSSVFSISIFTATTAFFSIVSAETGASIITGTSLGLDDQASVSMAIRDDILHQDAYMQDPECVRKLCNIQCPPENPWNPCPPANPWNPCAEVNPCNPCPPVNPCGDVCAPVNPCGNGFVSGEISYFFSSLWIKIRRALRPPTSPAGIRRLKRKIIRMIEYASSLLQCQPCSQNIGDFYFQDYRSMTLRELFSTLKWIVCNLDEKNKCCFVEYARQVLYF